MLKRTTLSFIVVVSISDRFSAFGFRFSSSCPDVTRSPSHTYLYRYMDKQMRAPTKYNKLRISKHIRNVLAFFVRQNLLEIRSIERLLDCCIFWGFWVHFWLWLWLKVESKDTHLVCCVNNLKVR